MPRARWGGDEGNLGREVSTEVPRRGRRPGRNRRAPEGLCEGSEPAAPPLRGSRGNGQDDLCDGPGARHVWGELAAELLRVEQQRRAGDRDRSYESEGDRAARAVRGNELQDHLPRRGRQPDRGRPGRHATDHGDLLEDLAVHPVRELLLASDRADPIAYRGLPFPTAQARGDPRIRRADREGGEAQDHGGRDGGPRLRVEGDMRRAVNSLQVAASLGATIDADVLYKVASTIRPEEVKKLIEKALEGEFLRAREVLDRLLIEYGLSGEDIVRQLHRTVFDLNVPDESKVRLLDRIGETDFRLTEGSSERIQIEALLAHFALIGQELNKK